MTKRLMILFERFQILPLLYYSCTFLVDVLISISGTLSCFYTHFSLAHSSDILLFSTISQTSLDMYGLSTVNGFDKITGRLKIN